MMDDMDTENSEAFEAFEVMLRQSVQFVVNVEPDAEKFINFFTSLTTYNFFEFVRYLNSGGTNWRECTVAAA